MKRVLGLCFFLLAVSAIGQTRKEDGTWWDNELAFDVVWENLNESGELIICVKSLKTDNCVENLTTGFQVNIYDAQDKELWNSIWTGRKLDIKFKKNFPDAARVEIKANKNYVINTMTGTRIYQDEPLQLDYKLTE